MHKKIRHFHLAQRILKLKVFLLKNIILRDLKVTSLRISCKVAMYPRDAPQKIDVFFFFNNTNTFVVV